MLIAVTLSCSASLCFATVAHVSVIPLPQSPNPKSEKVQLGKSLFYDKVFSKNKNTSCASCHEIRHGGMDGLKRYQKQSGIPGEVNTLSVLNTSYNFRYFWNGRAKTLEEALDDHVVDKTVLNNNWATIIERINQNPRYLSIFKTLYPDGVTENNIKNAIIAYLNNLLTPDSAFDRYLQGDKSALSDDAQRGYILFKKYGCITCHQGPILGGNLYEKLGIYKDFYPDKTKIKSIDLGYYNVTKKEEDKFVFKVPSLRNVALTGPYFHDGSVETLAEAVDLMGIYQSGQKIPDHEIPYIVKFLQSLTGRIQPDLINSVSDHD